ncbi:MAG: electron transfer flavoprotein subunit beta/FixA family protein [Acidilobaceae archaeon]|nr:electron transfer flavoprotein subunit beta/FixA family protein [Acidilobaceae archaeon]MDW7974521.1 electron transfer flavoprotein subunit beta/FixA family protein [Sulfolobales archaeon]
MRIVVGVKWVPNTQAVRIDPETGTLIRKGVPSIVNPHDLPAVEAALRLRERVGGEVIVVSMAPPPAVKGLELVLGMGADRAVLVTDRVFAGADTWATSYVLSRAIQKISAEIGRVDLVLFGHETIDSSTSHVQAQVASWLDWPYVYYVSSIEPLGDNAVRVERELEEYEEEYVVELPAVVSIAIKAMKPRPVSLQSKLRAKLERRIITWTNADLKLDPRCVGLKGSPTVVAKTVDMPEVPRKKEVYRPRDPKDAARWIIRKMVEDEKLREVMKGIVGDEL